MNFRIRENYFTVSINFGIRLNIFTVFINIGILEYMFTVFVNFGICENNFTVFIYFGIRENIFTVSMNFEIRENIFAVFMNVRIHENIFLVSEFSEAISFFQSFQNFWKRSNSSENLHAHVRGILTLVRIVNRLRWMEMAGSAEAKAAHQSKVAREIQSSNEEISQHISTF